MTSSTEKTITPKIARSWLLTAASRPEIFQAAVESGADAVILDVEDAVAPQHKAKARQDTVDWLSSDGNHAWVRINDATTDFWADDLDALHGVKGLDGIMLAKVENPEQIADTAARLPGGTPILALVESAVGLEAVSAIAHAPSTFRLAFGTGDFRRDTNIGTDPRAIDYARSRLVIASRAARLPGPIDGPTLGTSHTMLKEQSAWSVQMGMTGKLCLQPEQAQIVNRAISPTPDDIDWAREVISSFEADGGGIRNGSDLPRLARAQKITELAIAFGQI